MSGRQTSNRNALNPHCVSLYFNPSSRRIKMLYIRPAAWRANEPWIRGRVLIGPHSGFYSPDSLVDLRTKAAETVRQYLKEGKLINCVNAEYLKNPR